MSKKSFPSPEYELLESLKPFLNFRVSARYPIPIGDDAAIRSCSAGERLAVTADSFVQGVHFALSCVTLEEAGYKAAAVNLSDCAAMAAVPDGAIVQIVFPKTLSRQRCITGIRRIYKGLGRACGKWKFPIVGGNLSCGPCWIIDMTLLCRAGASDRLLLRTGAQAGDGLWVTGNPGDSAAGLACLRKWGRPRVPKEFKRLVSRHVRPEPRIEIARRLAANLRVHALIDVSDGISKDSRTLAFENGLGMELDGEPVCVSSSARLLGRVLDTDWREWYLSGGEDYELLFAAAPGFEPAAVIARYKVPISRIGTFVPHAGEPLIKYADGRTRRLGSCGWDHLPKIKDRDVRPF
jgi:thiamine-monophosphate kinase